MSDPDGFRFLAPPPKNILDIKPRSYHKPQRIEAVEKATQLGMGVHMAVGNATTDFYADPEVPIGKVRITMPVEYKGFPQYITTLDSAEEDWCPREGEHTAGQNCKWCEGNGKS